MDNLTNPTQAPAHTGPLTTRDVMNMTGKSRSAVNRIARLHKLGRRVGAQMRVYSLKEVKVVMRVKSGNPNWKPGVPQPHRHKKAMSAERFDQLAEAV